MADHHLSSGALAIARMRHLTTEENLPTPMACDQCRPGDNFQATATPEP